MLMGDAISYACLDMLHERKEKGDVLIDFAVCWLYSFRWSNIISALQWDTMGYTQFNLMRIYQTDGIVQERRNSIANALELRLSCTNPSKWYLIHISRPQLLSDNICGNCVGNSAFCLSLLYVTWFKYVKKCPSSYFMTLLERSFRTSR